VLRAQPRIRRIYETLYAAFGPQRWWPGETPFEVMVGAILTQNTAWTNVERAIGNLKRAGRLSADGILACPAGELADLIRPSGYFNLKAKRLKSYVQWYRDRFGADPAVMRRVPIGALRAELLTVYGIGRETADSILLYACGLPAFVVDAYTLRIFSRLGVIPDRADYESVRARFMKSLPEDPALYNEYHALIVALGKDWCRPRARCEGCPLRRERHRRRK
jgi:endonuclease III related protein